MGGSGIDTGVPDPRIAAKKEEEQRLEEQRLEREFQERVKKEEEAKLKAEAEARAGVMAGAEKRRATRNPFVGSLLIANKQSTNPITSGKKTLLGY